MTHYLVNLLNIVHFIDLNACYALDLLYDMETWMEVAEDLPQILSNDYSDGESQGHEFI